MFYKTVYLYCQKVGLLLLESLSLLGYFALFHPENQAVLRWGKSPTILHKVNEFIYVVFTCVYIYIYVPFVDSLNLKYGKWKNRFAICHLFSSAILN